jgi:hypothetical protein
VLSALELVLKSVNISGGAELKERPCSAVIKRRTPENGLYEGGGGPLVRIEERDSETGSEND